MYRPLTEPVEAWHFSMRCPPEESGRKSLDMHFIEDGIFNAVLFWHTLELAPGVTISSAPALVSDAGESCFHASWCCSWQSITASASHRTHDASACRLGVELGAFSGRDSFSRGLPSSEF